MFKYYFESLDGIDAYPIFSLMTFFVFFLIVIVWSCKADKTYLKKMEELPIESKAGENGHII